MVQLDVRIRWLTGLLLTGGCYLGSNLEPDADDATGTGTDAAETSPGGESGAADTSTEDTGDPSDSAVLCDGDVLDPGRNLLRRFTITEYGNTIEALLGVDVRAEAIESFPDDFRADGFSNTTAGLVTTVGHVEAYFELAELAMSRVADLDAFAMQYTSCTEFGDACQDPFVRGFGRRAFRRPVTSEETDRFAQLFEVVEADGDPFEDGVSLVVLAMLQSAPFLFRLEDETSGDLVRALDGYELATRLSYLLWGGPPDDTLLNRAEEGALQSDDALVEQVDRMLAMPEARRASIAFAADWLHLSRMKNIVRDPEMFPQWQSALAEAMDQETRAFFESVVWDDNRRLSDLYNAQQAWLTPELAAHYGLRPQSTEGLRAYDVSAVPERGGLLTQGSMLAIGGDHSDMVGRGLFVLKGVLCGDLASPPADVDTTVPEVGPGASQRMHSEARTSDPLCGTCHVQMEPFAWGLERYRADGQFAEQDHHGNVLREDGTLRFPGDDAEYPFSRAEEMMTLVAEHPRTQTCMALKGTQYALGRKLGPSDRCSLERLQERFDTSDGTWRDLMVAIVLSPGFRHIRVEAPQ